MPQKPLDLPAKCCERCGTAMSRKRFGARLEDASAFLKRRYCSRSCANSRGNWGASSTARHREAHKSVGTSCARCGVKNRRFHVHHKDEDIQNNLPGNLETLCPSCHKREHL